MQHDTVAEAGVVGAPHEVLGEAVVAFVVLKEGVEEGEEALLEQLKAEVKASIAGYAVPRVLLVSAGRGGPLRVWCCLEFC